MSARTAVQIGLLAVGLGVWAYGQRYDDTQLRLVGIAFFAGATMLRFFRTSDTRQRHGGDARTDGGHDDQPEG